MDFYTMEMILGWDHFVLRINFEKGLYCVDPLFELDLYNDGVQHNLSIRLDFYAKYEKSKDISYKTETFF